MRIAAAQISCKVGEIQENLETHYRAIEAAIDEKVQLISFPEMSITGYCRTEGESLAFKEQDNRLDKLQNLSTQGKIIIIAGAAIKIGSKLHIGSFIISPNQAIQIYIKQHLHGEENLFYVSSMNYNPIIHMEDEQISLAICADINVKDHPSQAKKNNSTLYLPSIFDNEEGVVKAHHQLRDYAKKHSLTILMANYIGQHWEWKAGGESALWNSNGDLVFQLSPNESALLLAEKINGNWSATKVIVP